MNDERDELKLWNCENTTKILCRVLALPRAYEFQWGDSKIKLEYIMQK